MCNPASRLRVQKQTFDLLISPQPKYTSPNGTTISLPTQKMLDDVKKNVTHDEAPRPPPRSHVNHTKTQPPTTQPTMEVIPGDCLTAAHTLLRTGHNPFVLNMANAEHPGGGWQHGAGAQEENMFRRSNYVMHLTTCAEGWGGGDVRYPIPEFGGVYSPNVVVFRGEEKDGYPFLDEPFTVGMVACAAYCQPPLIYGNPLEEPGLSSPVIEAYKRKIRSLLNIGLLHNHDSAVLSAFGCGAFGNPPTSIAQIFKEVIEDEGFMDADGLEGYRRIVFAIFDDARAYQAHNPRGNLRPFQEVFSSGVEEV